MHDKGPVCISAVGVSTNNKICLSPVWCSWSGHLLCLVRLGKHDVSQGTLIQLAGPIQILHYLAPIVSNLLSVQGDEL